MATAHFLALWRRVVTGVDRLSEAYDGKWRKRRRRLGTREIAIGILKLVATKAFQSYGAMLAQASLGTREPQVAASSFCVARRKLSENFFKHLHELILAESTPRLTEPLWRGRRIFAVDGTKLTLPRELAQAGFRVPARGFYPQALLSCLWSLGTKIPQAFCLEAHEDERRCAFDHLAMLHARDVCVYDRGYFSYALYTAHQDQGVDAIFRVSPSGNFREIEAFCRSSARERIVTFRPSHAAVEPATVRLVKYRRRGNLYCLATTLTSKRHFPSKALAAIYFGRWGVEEFFKTTKRSLGLEAFHAKSDRGVRQEIYAALVILTLARRMGMAGVGPLAKASLADRLDPPEQANFSYAIDCLAQHLSTLLASARSAKGLRLLLALCASLHRLRRKRRPGRHFPRKSHRPHRRWMPGHHASQSA